MLLLLEPCLKEFHRIKENPDAVLLLLLEPHLTTNQCHMNNSSSRRAFLFLKCTMLQNLILASQKKVAALSGQLTAVAHPLALQQPTITIPVNLDS